MVSHHMVLFWEWYFVPHIIQPADGDQHSISITIKTPPSLGLGHVSFPNHIYLVIKMMLGFVSIPSKKKVVVGSCYDTIYIYLNIED